MDRGTDDARVDCVIRIAVAGGRGHRRASPALGESINGVGQSGDVLPAPSAKPEISSWTLVGFFFDQPSETIESIVFKPPLFTGDELQESYGLFACSGLLFIHVSPSRPERFVTRKIHGFAVRIANGSKERL